MIAKRKRGEDLDAVRSVKGIATVQLGASDEAMSLGLAGLQSHTDI